MTNDELLAKTFKYKDKYLIKCRSNNPCSHCSFNGKKDCPCPNPELNIEPNEYFIDVTKEVKLNKLMLL